MNTKQFRVFVSIILLALIIIFWVRPAEAAGMPLNFGGRILGLITCADGFLLTIGSPKPGLFMWMWGTPTFAWWQIRVGPWVLGNYSPGGVCVCPYGCCECGAIPALGTIIMIGTSK